MSRNKWGVLKANLQEVVTTEQLRSKPDLNDEDRAALEALKTSSVAVAHRPRSSFSDSKFAKKVKLVRPDGKSGSGGSGGGGSGGGGGTGGTGRRNWHLPRTSSACGPRACDS